MNIQDFETKLNRYKRELEKQKEEKTKLEWEQEQGLKELKELGFDSVEKAEQEIKKLDKKIIHLENKMEKQIQEFNHDFNFAE